MLNKENMTQFFENYIQRISVKQEIQVQDPPFYGLQGKKKKLYLNIFTKQALKFLKHKIKIIDSPEMESESNTQIRDKNFVCTDRLLVFSASPRKVYNEIKSKGSIPDFPICRRGTVIDSKTQKTKTDNNILLLQKEIVRF